jgi:hypothetical protein
MPQFPLPLPTNRAFVVQLRAQPPGAPLAWEGRVEHVVSGQATHFHFVCVPLLLHVGIASAQESYPIMEKVAQKVIEKYQTSSCQQLAQQKSQPPSGQKAQMEQRAIQTLRNDPQMRTEFLNRVAAPIANKMFECGMIP